LQGYAVGRDTSSGGSGSGRDSGRGIECVVHVVDRTGWDGVVVCGGRLGPWTGVRSIMASRGKGKGARQDVCNHQETMSLDLGNDDARRGTAELGMRLCWECNA
jgi:hypothetical protein